MPTSLNCEDPLFLLHSFISYSFLMPILWFSQKRFDNGLFQGARRRLRWFGLPPGSDSITTMSPWGRRTAGSPLELFNIGLNYGLGDLFDNILLDSLPTLFLGLRAPTLLLVIIRFGWFLTAAWTSKSYNPFPISFSFFSKEILNISTKWASKLSHLRTVLPQTT